RVAVLVEQNVVRLDVAVNYPLAMREPQRGGHIHAQPDEQRLGQGAHDLEPLVEARGQKIHHEKDGVGLPTHRQNPDDVRMPELGRRRRLAPKPALERLVPRVLRLQDLDGNGNLELGIVPAVYPRETTRPDDLVDAEATQLLADVALRHDAQAFTEKSTATKLLCFNEFGQRESNVSGEYT